MLKGAVGQQLAPPFHWTDPLRGKLHDLVRAFEAWAGKELGCVFPRGPCCAVSTLFRPSCFYLTHVDNQLYSSHRVSQTGQNESQHRTSTGTIPAYLEVQLAPNEGCSRVVFLSLRCQADGTCRWKRSWSCTYRSTSDMCALCVQLSNTLHFAQVLASNPALCPVL